MKYFVLLLLLAFSFPGVFAQLPDYSTTMKISWQKDPLTYYGSTRGRAIIANGTACAENGTRLRVAMTRPASRTILAAEPDRACA